MRVSTRLMLIIATCLLPTIGLQIAASWNQWTERKAQLGDLALHQAQLLAGDVGSIAEGARILLGTTAQFRQVRTIGNECSTRLARLLDNAPGFAFVARVDNAGQVRCASDLAVVGAEDGAGWARSAPLAPAFTAGQFTRSPSHPGGFLPFYLPLAGSETTEGGALVAALDLTWLEGHLNRLKRAGSPFLVSGVLTVADAEGVILGRDVRHAEFVGQRFPPAAMPIVRSPTPGILRLRSMDGTERVVGYTPPTPASHNLAVAVGFHEPD
ncbi:hypothetical protein [Siccirubricoccus sp. G192]|uniref:hypothetical protein n=1 Tax=Siccirubricoccus sp. G192 TaxID=2849651 RepID=UPI001C2B8227|nr:hypothetical protein [Siccirubricoccus sp. G192]MBV1797821.1 hypothetical protein [Siccirubricoccus sp. G192]